MDNEPALPLPPDARPPVEVRLTSVRAEPWPDRKRVRILLGLTPFQRRPNLMVRIVRPDGEVLSQADIIESMSPRLAFTMHLRGEAGGEMLRLEVAISYEDAGEVDRRVEEFRLDVPPA